MSPGHREQPKISEEGIWPASVIAIASTLPRTMKLSAQDRSQTATNKAVNRREGVSVGMLEVTEPATQDRVDRRDDALDRIAPVTLGQGTDSIPQPHETLPAHPALARLEPVTQKLEPMTLQPTIPNVGLSGCSVNPFASAQARMRMSAASASSRVRHNTTASSA
jgi:hypothetical protein